MARNSTHQKRSWIASLLVTKLSGIDLLDLMKRTRLLSWRGAPRIFQGKEDALGGPLPSRVDFEPLVLPDPTTFSEFDSGTPEAEL